jgi:UV DNA damage endonuclease
MTYSNFIKNSFSESLRELSERILHNFRVTHQTIKFCQQNNIQGYRLSSSLCPLLTHQKIDLKIRDLPNFALIKNECASIKDTLKRVPLRLSAHPSEYITLSSSDPVLIQNSIKDLEQHAEIFELLGLPESYECPLNIHVRKESEPGEISQKVLKVYETLSDPVRKRLVLENNDNANGVWSIKNLVKYFYDSFKIPITFDSLHHSILSGGLSARDAFMTAYDTWPVVPLFHYSEGVNGTRKHVDMPVGVPESYGQDVYFDVECKSKCQAIFQIRKNSL